MGGSLDRWPRTSTLAWILSPLVLATTLVFASPAHGKAAPVALGQVTTKVTRTEVDVSKAFRAEVLRQLRAIDLKDVPNDEPVVLSASLVRLETERSGNRGTSSCMVSATLHKKRGGALVAILRGKARAEDDINAKSDNEMTVMRAAVRGAIRGIPKALQ